jgi:hypothetical protein
MHWRRRKQMNKSWSDAGSSPSPFKLSETRKGEATNKNLLPKFSFSKRIDVVKDILKSKKLGEY